LHPCDASLIPQNLEELPRAPRRLMEVLRKGSVTPVDSSSKSWSLDFCLSPKLFAPSITDSSKVGMTTFERGLLSSVLDPKSHTHPTGEMVDIPSPIVFRSIGYKSEPLPGFTEFDIPFDDRRGTILNDGFGRVTREFRTQGAAISREPYPGLYSAGWVKRGPTGVIASTMEDAFATGDAIAKDWSEKAPFLGGAQPAEKAGWQGVLSEAGGTGARVVTWDDWRRIDEAEVRNGRRREKARDKYPSTAEMLAALQS